MNIIDTPLTDRQLQSLSGLITWYGFGYPAWFVTLPGESDSYGPIMQTIVNGEIYFTAPTSRDVFTDILSAALSMKEVRDYIDKYTL